MRVARLNLSLILLLWSGSLVARDFTVSVQNGLLSGAYAGASRGTIEMPNALDVQVEVMTTGRHSYSARSLMSLDSESGVFRYLYTGLGTRYYFSSYGTSQIFELGNSKIELRPRVQYFAAGEVGLSQMVVQQITNSFSVNSTLIEAGTSLGGIYPLTSSVGLFGSVGVFKGIGISAVAVDTDLYKVLVGLRIQ